MRAKEAVSQVKKPTVSGASTNKEPTYGPEFRQYILRADGQAHPITAQAQYAFHSMVCLRDPICHDVNGFLELRQPASPWIPSDPTRKTPSSSVCLAGLHQNSNWERETAFNPPVWNSH